MDTWIRIFKPIDLKCLDFKSLKFKIPYLDGFCIYDNLRLYNLKSIEVVLMISEILV